MKNSKRVCRGISIVLAAFLVVSMVGCGKADTEPSESSIPETTEVTEASEATEMIEETEVTEHKEEQSESNSAMSNESKHEGGSSSRPAGSSGKPSGNGGSSSKPSKPSGNGGSSSKPSKPIPSEPKPTPTEPKPVPTEPKPTPTEPKPVPTEPPATEPPVTEHVHHWTKCHHDEVGHWGERTIVCSCGWRCTESQAKAAGMELTKYWALTHAEPEEDKSGVNHSYDEDVEWVVDTPAYDEWVCDCGETTRTEP